MAERDHSLNELDVPNQEAASTEDVAAAPAEPPHADGGYRTRLITLLIVVCVSLLLIRFGTVSTHSYLRNSENRVVKSIRDVGLRDLWERQANNLPSFGPDILPKIIFYSALAVFLIACTVLVWYALAPNRAWLPDQSTDPAVDRRASEVSEGSGAGD